MMKLTSKTILFGALAGAALLLSLQAQADNVTLTTSDLPIVIINTDAEINADAKIPGTMQIIDNGSGQTNSVSDTPNGFDGHIGIKLRGESSLNFNQKKYTIETWDAQGNDSTVSIFGMPEESDWVLLAPYNDVSMVRDVYAFALWNEMGHWGPRTRMCEVIVNNDYRGVYAFCERIKRDKNRVDISKLKPEDISGRDLTGGYIVRIDAYDEEDLTFQSKVPGIQKSAWAWGGNQQQEAPVTWTIYYPKKEDIVEPQRQYIQDFEIACDGPDQPVRMLSGGNIQKVVVAREFTSGANFVIANQPTRGVDVGTAEMIRKYLVRMTREKGIGSLLISADLNEVLEVSDRLFVMRQGKIVAAFPKANVVDVDVLGEYMLGIKTMTAEEMEGLL